MHNLKNQSVFLKNEPTLEGPTIGNESKLLINSPESLTIIGSEKVSFNRSKTGLENACDTFN